VERGPIPLVAPLHAALDAAAQRPYQEQCQDAPRLAAADGLRHIRAPMSDGSVEALKG